MRASKQRPPICILDSTQNTQNCSTSTPTLTNSNASSMVDNKDQNQRTSTKSSRKTSSLLTTPTQSLTTKLQQKLKLKDRTRRQERIEMRYCWLVALLCTLATGTILAAASQQQQQQVSGQQLLFQSADAIKQYASRGKKVQIVYVKVPLSKLKTAPFDSATNGTEAYASSQDSNATLVDTYAAPTNATSAANADYSDRKSGASILIPMLVPGDELASVQLPSVQPFFAGTSSKSVRAAPQQAVTSNSNAGVWPLNFHGFMSGFLSGEKEKYAESAASPAPILQAAYSTHNNNLQQFAPPPPQAFGMLPDSMLGPAYNSAVNHALPAESGSAPAGGQGSATVATAPPQASGAYGQAESSLQASQSGQYTRAPPDQSAGSAPLGGYQSLPSSSTASGQLQSFGNGAAASGASSDYRGGQKQSSATNGAYSRPQVPASPPPQPQPQSQPQDNRQEGQSQNGKKTIIPVVFQVEHGYLDGQQQANSKPRVGNKYRATKDQQYINAANSDNIAAITAQIQAENAAAFKAAIEQADAAISAELRAKYFPQTQVQPQASTPHQQSSYQQQQQHHHHHSQQQHHHQHQNQLQHHQQQQQQQPASQLQAAYMNAMQSAASALLGAEHPMLHAASSVSKLGAKLGEMIVLPVMQGQAGAMAQALPAALTSLTSQMNLAQLGQAMHDAASSYAQTQTQHQQLVPNAAGALAAAASQAFAQHALGSSFPQALVSAASGLSHAHTATTQQVSQPQKGGFGLTRKARRQRQGRRNRKARQQQPSQQQLQQQQYQVKGGPASAPLSPLVQQQQYPQTATTSAHLIGVAAHPKQSAVSAAIYEPQTLAANNAVPHMVNLHHQQQLAAAASAPLPSVVSVAEKDASTSGGSAKSGLKSKFLAFLQPPKLLTSLLNWNDKADERSDAFTGKAASEGATATAAAAPAPEVATLAAAVNATAAATAPVDAPVAAVQQPTQQAATIAAPVVAAVTPAPAVAPSPAPVVVQEQKAQANKNQTQQQPPKAA